MSSEKTLWEEIDELQGKFVSKGDIMAGIAVILELVGLLSMSMGVATIVKLVVATIIPPAAPFLSGAILYKLSMEVAKKYAELPSHKRQVVAYAIGWLQGKLPSS